MTTKLASQIIDKVVDLLSDKPGVVALVLAGSQVKGAKFTADRYSDIELYVVADSKKFKSVERIIHNIQKEFDNTVLAYKNQWAGWSLLFEDLLRLELPLVKASDREVFSRHPDQKLKVLYKKDDFNLKGTPAKKEADDLDFDWLIKDFWYMAVYAAQHIGRGELWNGRKAITVSMQSKVKKLIQLLYYKDTINLEEDRRIEFTWDKRHLKILQETSCGYDKKYIINAFWKNIECFENLLEKSNKNVDNFKEYKNKLTPLLRNYFT